MKSTLNGKNTQCEIKYLIKFGNFVSIFTDYQKVALKILPYLLLQGLLSPLL